MLVLQLVCALLSVCDELKYPPVSFWISVCTVSPTVACFEESHNTLKFADRAKAITNKAKLNEVKSSRMSCGHIPLIEFPLGPGRQSIDQNLQGQNLEAKETIARGQGKRRADSKAPSCRTREKDSGGEECPSFGTVGAKKLIPCSQGTSHLSCFDMSVCYIGYESRTRSR